MSDDNETFEQVYMFSLPSGGHVFVNMDEGRRLISVEAPVGGYNERLISDPPPKELMMNEKWFDDGLDVEKGEDWIKVTSPAVEGIPAVSVTIVFDECGNVSEVK